MINWVSGVAALGLLVAALFSSGIVVASASTTGGGSAHSHHQRSRHCPRHHHHEKCRHHRPHPQAFDPSLRHVRRVKVQLGGRGGTADPGNDYPLVWRNAAQDSLLDNWREYNRECTSFVAWALASRNGFNMPFFDNANRWGPDARARGFAVNSSPAPGSVAWSNAGAFGHVAYVQDVSGSSVHIEEYNHDGTGHYSSRVVPASSFSGYIHFKDRPTAPSVPPSTPQTGPIDDLGFVKTTNTSGTVEAHWDTVQNGAFKRAGDYASDFSPADAGNGVWQLFGSANGAPELGFIKTHNTGTNSIEVHFDTLQSGSYKRAGDYASDFSPADAGNGVWQLFGSANGAPELGFIKTHNTGTNSIEVHFDTLQSGSYKRAGDYASDFSPADAGNGVWQLFGSANGAPELGFIKLLNTSGTVEVHWDTLQGGTYRRVGDYVSDFSPADAGNGAWNLFGSESGVPRLGFVKLQNTGSGEVEGHADALEGSAFKRTADYVSDFSPADAGNGEWQIGYP